MTPSCARDTSNIELNIKYVRNVGFFFFQFFDEKEISYTKVYPTEFFHGCVFGYKSAIGNRESD